MPVSSEILAMFAKTVVENKQEKKSEEAILNGTVVNDSGTLYVRIDGSDRLTPVASTTSMENGERVTVLIKNHSAIVTGNLSSPSVGQGTIDGIQSQIVELDTLIADTVKTDDLEAINATISNIIADNVLIRDQLTATSADIGQLEADNVVINNKLTAAEAEIDSLDVEKLDAEVADLTYATIDNLEATNADIHNLLVDYGDFKVLSTGIFTAINASIDELQANKLDAESANIHYANIDFANIGDAAIENFFAKSGMIGDLVVNNGTVTGTLVGVTIKGDLIEGGTVVADKLVLKGDDGLYYKLNTDGETISTQQTEYNSLNGSIITAKSITAEKINVGDLVAFGATIGGYHITDNAIYSGVKESVLNTTRGVYMDNDGQFSLGDSFNYLRFYKDTDGKYKLAISASQLTFGSTKKDLETVVNSTIKSTVEQFYQSTSPTVLAGGSWSSSQPVWTDGTYIWRRTLITYTDDRTAYTPSETGVCITGNSGSDGVGIQSSVVSYQVGTSGTTVPTGEWLSSVPNVPAGSYLWTRTVFTYTDGSETTSYSIGLMGQNGEGKGIESTEITYQIGASQTTPPEGEWSLDVPQATEANPYLWTKTVITYTDNTVSTMFSVSMIGSKTKITDTLSGSIIAVGENAGKRPLDLIVYGNTQDGVSITSLAINIGGASVPIDLNGNTIESYSDGSRDVLRIDRLGNVTLVKVSGEGTDTIPLGTIDVPALDPSGSTISVATNVATEMEVTYWCVDGEEVANSWEAADNAQTSVDNVQVQVTQAESRIESLGDMISTLVTDENGTSLMTQTSTGWKFNIGSVQSAIDEANDKISTAEGSINEMQASIDSTESLLNDTASRAAYINMTTDDTGAPCIELGKDGDQFRVRITNTSVDFMDGSDKIAYITNKALYIETAVIRDELRIGEAPGFIWKRRSNGNMGLRWEA